MTMSKGGTRLTQVTWPVKSCSCCKFSAIFDTETCLTQIRKVVCHTFFRDMTCSDGVRDHFAYEERCFCSKTLLFQSVTYFFLNLLTPYHASTSFLSILQVVRIFLIFHEFKSLQRTALCFRTILHATGFWWAIWRSLTIFKLSCQNFVTVC